ncbi:MAG: PIG-L family deacetylase [Acidobacteria bacterium]|nr:PIG-L family deacetylase [Acidobacteriota bacterium]
MRERSRGDLLNPSGLGRVLLLSPHDDDGVVGCGGLIAVLPEPPTVVITSDGRFGYHSLAEREGFVEQREREALAAYGSVGVPPEKIIFLRYPDMSVRNYQNWVTPDGQPGAYQTLFRILRSHRPDTMLVPSELDFHPDHKVIAEVGLVAAVQARESLIPEMGPPVPVARLYAYQVWEPIAEVTHRFVLEAAPATRKRKAIDAFASQLDAFARMHELGTLRYDEERFVLVRAFPAEPLGG